MHKFSQRFQGNHFIFLPSVNGDDTNLNDIDAILNHPIAIGI